jgi:TonB family protein
MKRIVLHALVALTSLACQLQAFAASEPDPRPISTSSDIGDIMGKDRPLAITRQIPPRYPADLKAAGVSGTVTVEVEVGADGQVGEIRILKSPHSALSEAVVEAVKQFKFRPLVKNGQAVGTKMQQQFTFNLNAAG